MFGVVPIAVEAVRCYATPNAEEHLLNMRLSAFIARLPFNALRLKGYRSFGYSLGARVEIGYKTTINSKTCVLADGVQIGSNCALYCGEACIGANTRIHSGNIFSGAGKLTIGANTRIINNHYFDCWNGITLGDNCWVAGRASQFWTHGTLKTTRDQSIVIGNDVYIGSSCLFAPGSGVADGCLVALGSVVTRRFEDKQCVIGGNPARLLMSGHYWRENWS